MRQRLFLALVTILLALAGCGGGGQRSDSLTNYVKGAMADLPYEYRLLPKLRTGDYVVFRTTNPRKKVDVNMAFGLPSKRHSCPRLPESFSGQRKDFRPFVGAAGVPLICLAVDSLQPVDSQEDAIIVANMESHTALALCEQVHGGWACFD